MAGVDTTWGEALAAAEGALRSAGIEDAALDAVLLVGHVVGASRTLVRLHRERHLDAAATARLAELVARRAGREPLPYVVGTQEFLGLPFGCDARALVPRWDTEALAEAAIERLGKRSSPRVADIGTGSGILAISLAYRLPAARVWAVDLSPAALELATANARALAVDDRIEFVQGDLAAPLSGLTLDGIVANLPYIPTADLAGLEPEVRDHEPRGALDGGPDGLDLIRRLVAQVPPLLAPGGFLLLECGDGQAPAVDALLDHAGWRERAVIDDWGGRPRGVVGVRPA